MKYFWASILVLFIVINGIRLWKMLSTFGESQYQSVYVAVTALLVLAACFGLFKVLRPKR